MKSVILEELRRLYKVLLIILALSFIIIFTNQLINKNEVTILFDYKVIRYSIITLYLIVSLTFCLDTVSAKRMLYLKSSIETKALIYGRFFVVLIMTSFTSLILILFINIKTNILYNNNYIEYLRLNFDDLGLIVFNKSFMEWLYIPNFLMNLSFYFFVLYLFFWYYKKLQIRKREKSVDMFISIIVVLFPAYFLVLISNFLTHQFDFLNFNKLSQRIRAFVNVGLEVNFLSVITLLIYLIAFNIILGFITKKEVE